VYLYSDRKMVLRRERDRQERERERALFVSFSTTNLLQLLPQNLTDPCLTNYLIGQEYIIASPPYTDLSVSPPAILVPPSPDCFYLFLNQCDYFKLVRHALSPQLNLVLCSNRSSVTSPLLKLPFSKSIVVKEKKMLL
jgi:hypothetical protein